MTFLQGTGLILDAAWTCLTTVNWPGTEISVGMILIGASLVCLGLRVLQICIDANMGGAASTIRGGK